MSYPVFTDYQGSGDIIPCDKGLDCRVLGREQGYDSVHDWPEHADRAGM